MNYTVMIGKALFKIDDYLGNRNAQIVLLLACISLVLFTDTWFNIWLSLGFISYFALHLWNYLKKEDYGAALYLSVKEHGWLGMLKGFNYSLLTGPLAVLLKAFLGSLDKIDRENINQ